jgi:hypothetical protein
MTSIQHVAYSDALLIGTMWLRLKFCRFCSRASNEQPVWRSHARRRKEDRRAGLASRGMWSDGVVSPPVCRQRGVPARGVVPDRCNSWRAAVDICSDAPAWAQRAERAADGGVVYVSRALSVSPSAPRINAQRGALFDPYHTRNCLPPKKLRREIQ